MCRFEDKGLGREDTYVGGDGCHEGEDGYDYDDISSPLSSPSSS